MKKKRESSLKLSDCQKCGDRGMAHKHPTEEEYHVACLGCHARTALFPTVKEAVEEWNNGEVSVPERLVQHAETG